MPFWLHQLIHDHIPIFGRHKVTSDVTAERLLNTCWDCPRCWVWYAREPRRHAPPMR
jgi:hypothetical protein